MKVSSGYSTGDGQMATGGVKHWESFGHMVESNCESAGAQFENISPGDIWITERWVSSMMLFCKTTKLA